MSIEALSDSVLNEILKCDLNDCVLAPESETLEFKEVYDWDSSKEVRSKYAKSLAAFANNKGGYLVFGVENRSKFVVGISNFDQIDQESITSFLNRAFQPSIKYHKRSFTFNGKQLGVFYVEKRLDIPIICQTELEKVLRESEIYYRYYGKTDRIKSGDLIKLLLELKNSGENSQNRRNDQKPIFDVEFIPNPQNQYSFKFLNKGNKGWPQEVEELDENDLILNPVDFWKNKLVQNGEYWIVLGRSKIYNSSYLQTKFNFKIKFNDLDGKKYFQRVYKAGNLAKIDPPVSIE